MKRALVFLLFGPASVVLATWIWVGMPTGDFVINVAVALFLLTLPVSGIVGLMDRYLATVFPILVRAPLTTMAGATVAFVLPAALLGPMPQDMSLPFGGAGALCAGVCSLLAQDYRSQKARPGDTSGSPS